jgi:hypothetical protein
MPEPVWISDVMGESMADAGIKVNITIAPAVSAGASLFMLRAT